ncbi:HAMP domain-containing sensor histidine kinase [Humibacillus xanthopallidus]|uniref:HAMP domain-containing sensor histidine kinase n=1 Tax=Humibacillus xanthopallidus TaxID=412689 RepID=UPI001153F830|nr:HAMP domain-containing sensor histidine kinase [Humibacillus xanthopallidus]
MTVAFGLLSLAVSAVLSLLIWSVLSSYLVTQRESMAVAEGELGRTVIEEGLVSRAGLVTAPLDGLPTTQSSASLCLVGGQWYSTSPRVPAASLPTALVDAVTSGQESTQRVELGGSLVLAVGVPLTPAHSGLFEVFPLTDLDQTLRTLSTALALGAAATALLGAALGRGASRLALRPLAELGSVAAAVAEGRLDARLQTDRDPDLGPLGASFNRAVAELEHRVEADSRFAADVSHELRTPLTTMLNSMQVIKNREASLPASVREPLDLLAEELERFRRLVVDLLEMARHDAGQGLVLEEVNLADLVRTAADHTAGRPVTEPAHPLMTRVDKRGLERVVANLVSNAELHGGGVLAVRLSRRGPIARIEVDDAGPGVPGEQRGRVFDRFSRGTAPSERAGLGLGLAIVQRHVALHGGSVAVEDRPGGGARFAVELPITDV